MRLINAYQQLLAFNQPVIRTDIATNILNIETSHASKILARLCKAGFVFHLKYGLWLLDKNID